MRPALTREIACAVGCEVTSVEEGASPRVKLSCPTGWAAARLLLELARADGPEPGVRAIVSRLGRFASKALYARAVHEFVGEQIRFEREDGEIFQSPTVTLARGVGDCDCHARLIFAALDAYGVPARLAFLHRGGGPLHVVAQAFVDGVWRWLETTVKGAHFGEHPLAAVRRLGTMRADVARGMREVYMGSQLIEGGGVYVVRVGLMREGADVAAALAELGFEATRIYDAPPVGSPPHVQEPVACAPSTAWAEVVATRAGSSVAALPIFHAGLLFDDFHLLKKIELPPDVPHGLRVMSSIEQVQNDAGALRKLGYDVPDDVAGPLDVRFRSAVAAFQRKVFPRGGTIDGLTGPKLRAAIFGSLSGVSSVGPSLSHVDAARIVQAAWTRVHGRPPSVFEGLFTQSIAFLETGYGRRDQFGEMAARGEFNWGAMEWPVRPDGKCDPGFVRGKDLGPVCFFAFKTDEDAAEAFIKLLTKTKRWPVIAAMATGSAEAVARAMRGAPAYYSGRPGLTDEQKIAEYARAIRSAANAIRPSAWTGTGAAIVILPFLALAGAVGYLLKS